MIQEEIGSETKFNVNNNNNVDWLKDKADGEHFDKNHFQYKTFLCCLWDLAKSFLCLALLFY